MYLKTFGLREKPFHITPNPRFIFLSKNHKEAFAHLLYGVQQRVGFMALVGEVGTGKTTVLRTLLQQLEEADCQVALIFNPCLSSLELLQTIHREFGIPYNSEEQNLARLHDSLNRFLLEQRQAAKTVVLVIDEAQNLDPAVLEQLRLLSNLETETDKLLQLVIVGQPELDEVLARHELRQLKQRLIVRYRLTNMDAEDTAAYIRHRLRVAGHAGGQLFSAAALKRIFALTHGLPRLINILCDRALLVAYTREEDVVGKGVVNEASAELANERKPANWRPWAVALCVFLVLAGVFLFADIPGRYRKLAGLRGIFDPAPGEPAVAATAVAPRPDTPPKTQGMPAGMDGIDPLRLARLHEVADRLGEVESARVAAAAVLKLWGEAAPADFDPDAYRPMEAAIRGCGMNVIRFEGTGERLLELDTPAVLALVLPNLIGKRYLALLQVDGDRFLTEPALSEDGWLPLAYLDQLWFGKAVIPWRNFEQLPFLDLPGLSGQGVKRTQELLNQSGYPQLEPTGRYDAATIAAISDLQRRTGLAPDGRLGARTLLQLYRQVGVRMPQLGAEEMP